jgi:hypothetical protein
MTPKQHWLAAWLDENEITHDWELDNLLRTPTGVKRLAEFVEKAAHEQKTLQVRYPTPAELGSSIVAGRRLDLSGTFTCTAYDCLRALVDSTFMRIWHYFDGIVVEGISPVEIMEGLKSARSHDQYHFEFSLIRDQARLLLYLREIGAEPYTIFSHKPNQFCNEHWLAHAKSLGIFAAFDQARHDELVAKVVRSSEIEIGPEVPDFVGRPVAVRGSYFDTPLHLVVWGSEAPTKEAVVCKIIQDYATSMISDVELARRLTLPLAEPVNIPWIGKRKKPSLPTEADVALQLDLPVFRSLTSRDFLKLREDERPHFERFRAGLRAEINDHLAAAQAGTPVSVIAREIEEDYLRPGIAELEAQMRSSRKALVGKSKVNLSMTTTPTVIGALTSIPLIIGSVAALLSLEGLAVNSYMEDRKAIEKENLYFLWRARKQATH